MDIQEEEQLKDAEEEKGEDSPGMRELSEQIDAHIVVLDEENPNNVASTEAQNTPPSDSSSIPPEYYRRSRDLSC